MMFGVVLITLLTDIAAASHNIMSDYLLIILKSLSAGNFVKVKSMCNDPTRCVI